MAPRSGDIALINDNGSIVVGSNNFDLGGVGLRYEPNSQGGYDVVRMGAAFRSDLGRRVTLADDASSEEALAFGFSFYGASRGSAFVNSDGNRPEVYRAGVPRTPARAGAETRPLASRIGRA